MIRTRTLAIPVAIGIGALLFSLLFAAILSHAAHAAPAEAAPGLVIGSPMPGWLEAVALIALVLSGLGAILGGLSVVLHAIAPKTKTTLDDRAADSVDRLHDKVDDVLAVVRGIAPAPAPPLAKTPQGGFATPSIGLGIAVFGCFACLVIACATLTTDAKVAGQAVVDCTKQDEPKLLQLTLSFASQIIGKVTSGAAVDWDGLESQAEAEGTAIGQCAFLETWAKLHPAAPSGPVPAVAARTLVASPLDKMRGHSGGVQWKLSDGTVR